MADAIMRDFFVRHFSPAVFNREQKKEILYEDDQITTVKGNRKMVRCIGISYVDVEQLGIIEGLIQDVTDESIKTDKAETNSRIIEALLRASPDLLFLLDMDGTIRDYRTKETSNLLIPPEMFINKKRPNGLSLLS